MTDRTRDHAQLDELAAGYALHSLDPDDQFRFLSHLPGCRRCQHVLSDYTEVTAALAGTEPAGQPRPQLRERILAIAATGQDRASPPGPGAPDGIPPPRIPGPPRQHGRGRRRAILASAAAAAILVAGGAIGTGLAVHRDDTSAPLASCAAAGQCRELTLTSASTGKTAARLVISRGTVWLLPSGLPANNISRQVYVLWQITGAHTPLAVGSFDVTGHRGQLVRIGPLAVPYRGTWAFAVSREHGRSIPARPSRPVALGQVS